MATDIGEAAKTAAVNKPARFVPDYESVQRRLEALRLATACSGKNRSAKRLLKDARKLEQFLAGANTDGS